MHAPLLNRCTPCAAANDGSAAPSLIPNNGQQYIEDNGFSMSKVSFGSVLAPVGVSLMVYGFGAFFQLLPGTDASPIMLIYGFPMSLLGFALNYAQLKPVPCYSTAAALALRDTQCTDIQKQLREDVTRYRYGDEQHLDEALNRIFRFNTVRHEKRSAQHAYGARTATATAQGHPPTPHPKAASHSGGGS